MTSEKTLSNEELEARWSALRRVLDSEGAAACCSAIQSETDSDRRDQLFHFAIRKLGGGSGAPESELDAMVTIGDAAIAALSGREAQVNLMCFNLSANLCDCWGDGDSRQKRHFEAGLRYADLALALRRTLKKDAASFSMAHWARGKHLLSLGRAAEAADAFQESVDCEQTAARENGQDPSALQNAPGGLVNARAFLGLAMLQSSMAILRDRVEHGEGEMKEDAQIYLEQIQESIKRI
jgi:hypothetical protein